MKNILVIFGFFISGISFAKDYKFELGKQLFFDKVLSGNKNISCATCHHPKLGTGDNLPLSVGEGGSGLGSYRRLGYNTDGVKPLVPRNAPPLFNLGIIENFPLFHDGRIEFNDSYPSGIKSPAGHLLPEGLESSLAAQALFPVTSHVEMAGQEGDNKIADFAAKEDFKGVWKEVTKRVQNLNGYVEQFRATYSEIKTKEDIGIHHIGNAIGHFEDKAFRSVDSPYDRYLKGEYWSLNMEAMRGMSLFYGKAQCYTCHYGKFQTDGKFHSLALPHLGPGKNKGVDGKEDFGRELVTKNREDRYKFRTPSLRNVALTGPWGHNGAYSNLRDIVRHHLDPETSLLNFNSAHLNGNVVTEDNIPFAGDHSINKMLLASNDLPRVTLSEEEMDNIIEFLHALTDLRPMGFKKLIPLSVPSGLSLED